MEHDDLAGRALLAEDRRVEERQRDRGADGRADALAELPDRAGETALRHRDVSEGECLVGRDDEAPAQSADHHRRGHGPGRVRQRDEDRDDHQEGGRQEHGAQAPHDEGSAEPVDEVAAHPGTGSARGGEPDGDHARVDRLETETVLQEEVGEQEHRRQSREVRRRQQRAIAIRPHPEETQRNERSLADGLVVPLPQHEPADEEHEGDEQPPSQGVVVGRSRREQEREHEREHGETEQHRAERIELERPAGSPVEGRQKPDREGDGDETQRHVHPEDPAPPVLRAAESDRQPADRRAEGRGDADDRSEGTEGLAARGAAEQLLDDAENLGHLNACGDALNQAGDQQHGHRGRKRTDETHDREQAQADDEQRAPRSLITQASRRNEHEPEGQHVPRHDQPELRRRRPERILDRRQGDVDLREVEDRQSGDRYAYREGPPLRSW